MNNIDISKLPLREQELFKRLTKRNTYVINLEEYSINPSWIVSIKWPSEDEPTETMPDGTTEMSNPTGVAGTSVAVVTLAIAQNNVPLTLIFEKGTDDYDRLKEVMGR